MAEEILDGTGEGFKMKVDAAHRAHTFSVIESEDKYQNKLGDQWSVYLTATPTGANDNFFYLKNTGKGTIAITDIRVMSAVAETVYHEWVSGVPTFVNGADINPTPKNGGSAKTPDAIIKGCDSITGINSEGIIYFQRLDTANKMYKLSTSANIIIPQGKSIAFKATTGGSLIEAVVSIVNI